MSKKRRKNPRKKTSKPFKELKTGKHGECKGCHDWAPLIVGKEVCEACNVDGELDYCPSGCRPYDAQPRCPDCGGTGLAIYKNPTYKNPTNYKVQHPWLQHRWERFIAPTEKEEPPFCHTCQNIFLPGENVWVNLTQGIMLCDGCYGEDLDLDI